MPNGELDPIKQGQALPVFRRAQSGEHCRHRSQARLARISRNAGDGAPPPPLPAGPPEPGSVTGADAATVSLANALVVLPSTLVATTV